MTFKKTDKGYLIRLARGESIMTTLHDFCEEKGIRAGLLQGIGGVMAAEVGFYNLGKKEYEFKKLNEVLEIASLLGNVSIVEGKPFLHIHIVLADKDQKTYGGHLKEASVAGTCEIYLVELADEVTRSTDPETGLKLWDL